MKNKQFDEKVFYTKFKQSDIDGFNYLIETTDDKRTQAIAKDLAFLAGEVENGYPYEVYKEYREAQLGKIGINLTQLWRKYSR